MNNYFFYILMPLMMVATVYVLPSDLKKTKLRRGIILGYMILGIVSFTLMISSAAFISSNAIRELVNHLALLFFVINAAVLFVYILRCLITFIAIRLHAWKAVKLCVRSETFLICAALCSSLYLFGGIRHWYDVRTVIRDVNLTEGKSAYPRQVNIALLSDLHLGAGADANLVDELCNTLIQENPDMICIDGDLVDMTTKASDLEYFCQQITKVNPSLGFFYVEGNHEEDSILGTLDGASGSAILGIWPCQNRKNTL